MEELTTFYKILGVSPEASLLEVNQAYSVQLNKIRIVRNSGDPELQRLARIKAEEVNEAYAEIKKVMTIYRELKASFGEDAPLNRAEKDLRVMSPPSRKAPAKTGPAALDEPSPRLPQDDYAMAARTAAVDKAAEVIAAAVEAAAVKTAAARASIEKAESARTEAIKAAAERAFAEKAAAEKAESVIRNMARLAVCLLIVALAAGAYLFATKVVLPARDARLKAEREAAEIDRTSREKHDSERPRPIRRMPDQEASPVVEKPPVATAEPAADPALDAERDKRLAAAERQVRVHETRQAAWVKHAAERGDTEAENWLGTLYAAGTGVPLDYREAAKWYRKAAEQGHAEAQKNLAVLLAEGKGAPKDLREAVKWFRKSAGQGNLEAQRALEIWSER